MATAIASSVEIDSFDAQGQLFRELLHQKQKIGFLPDMQLHLSQYPSTMGTAYLITIDQLNSLVDTGLTDHELLQTQFDYEWEAAILTSVAWWHYNCVSMDVAYSIQSEEVDKNWIALRDAISAHYSAKYVSETTAVEVLRRYRVWTRSICAVIKKEWPSVDWSGLEQLV